MFLEAGFRKKFDEFMLDARIEAGKGEFVTLLGPSGSGKTTLLMLLAGLIPADEGTVVVSGRDVSKTPPEKRNFGVVFQEKILFPHLDVEGNVAFGVRMHGLGMDKARDALRILGLEEFARRNVDSLSGGEKQRVALARAIAYSPQLLLLDEPLKELDGFAKERIKLQLKELQSKLRITTIYVTHDVEEAFYLSDRLYLLHAGKIVQQGKPLDVFKHPANVFARRYFSPYSLLKVKGRQIIVRKTSYLAKPKSKI
ncbi:MAG: ABC transporter ATP-binding protein [Candidatus Micrarchaeota archaeon]